MGFLSNPKVRLALIVNGLYFISVFTPTPRHARPRTLSPRPLPQAERALPPHPTYLPPAPLPAVQQGRRRPFLKTTSRD